MLLVAMTALTMAGPVLAAGPDLGAAVARPDTSRFLPRWLHASLEAGVSWMQSPPEVSGRYRAGVAFGGGLTATATSRLHLAARFEYLDLPNDANGYLGGYQSAGGQVYASPRSSFDAFRGGHSVNGLAVAAVRAWRSLWVEAGAGHGYFSSGYPDIQFIDGLTGEFVDIPGESGWGPAYTAGLAYGFTVRRREHLYVGARWTRLERGGASLDFVPLVVGLRFD